MSRLGIASVVALSVILISINGVQAESTLWDLLIEVNVSNDPIGEGESGMIIGSVTDHAGDPLEKIIVEIRTDSETISTLTNSEGIFEGVFSPSRVAGTHVVYVKAIAEDGKIGLGKTIFNVIGEENVSSQTANLLSTPEALRYLNSSPEDFVNDSIGLTLYNYYQTLRNEFLEEQLVQEEINEQKQLIEEQRQISLDLLEQDIAEENPSYGTFSGLDYNQFVDNLDYSVRDLFVNQLNHTVNVFYEAQRAMEEVLENGGTLEEARAAYFEKASVPRDLMSSLTTEIELIEEEILIPENSTTVEVSTNQIIENQTSIKPIIEESVEIDSDGTTIQLGENVTKISLMINGTIIELFVNGTEVSQVSNSTQN